MLHRCRPSFFLLLALLTGPAAAPAAQEDAQAADKARAFAQFCGDGACAPQGLSQGEFNARFPASRYAAGGLDYFEREIERFQGKFLGHAKFTLEILLRIDRPGPAALSVQGLFTSWFDDDVAGLRQKDYRRTCTIVATAPLLCKIEADRVVIWFDRKMALHFVELAYDASEKSYKIRRHRVIRRTPG